MNLATYVCSRDETHRFTRLTDRNLENREACFFKACDGWMYPYEPPAPIRRWWEFWQ